MMHLSVIWRTFPDNMCAVGKTLKIEGMTELPEQVICSMRPMQYQQQMMISPFPLMI